MLSMEPRLKTVCRDQYEFKQCILDESIPEDHLARDIWTYVQSLDLSIPLRKIQSVKGKCGRPATDPKILLSVWLYATIQGIASARLIEEYTREHKAFIWLCGGVSLNYHTISDFRSNQEELLDDLLIQSVASLAQAGIITLERVSQDGMRVRASAGKNSFKKKETLRQKHELAKTLINDLIAEEVKNPGKCKSRLEVAKKRAAEERSNRLKSALEELNKLQAEKLERAKKKDAV